MVEQSDDLMNLGPFIKNYVFNSAPLRNLSLIAKLDHSQSSDSLIQARAAMTSQREVPQVKTTKTESGTVADVCKPLQTNGAGQSLPYKKRNWDSMYSGWSPPKVKAKFLTEKQTKIKNWLAVTFQYCPRHKNAKVSSRAVLQKAVKEFGPLTQKALGYLMYQAFPGVERMKDTRRGHIFKGIIEKNQTKKTRSRTDASLSPDCPPHDPNDSDSNLNKPFYHNPTDMEPDENEAPEPEVEHADDHRTSGYELVEVKMEPNEEYHDERLQNGYTNSPHGMDLRTTKSAELKQEIDANYVPIVNGERHYDSEPPLSPVSDSTDRHVHMDSQPGLPFVNYPLLRQSLRGKTFIHPSELPSDIPPTAYYPIDRGTILENGSVPTSVFHHPHPTAFFKLPQTLPEAHEQLAYLLRYIQAREEKFHDVEKQFSNLATEFQKMAGVLREFHLDQAEFFKKVGYVHTAPPCDGNNN